MESNAPTPDMFAAVVTAFADTLIQTYRQRWNRAGTHECLTFPWWQLERGQKLILASNER